MNNLEEKIQKTIKKYNLIQTGDKLVLAVSGGPDSIAMLDILRKMYQQEMPERSISVAQLVVAHVNHMIRKEAAEDEAFVKAYCNKNNIEFYSKSIDIKKIGKYNKIGTEEAGRIERYKFFNEILEKTNSNKIAIAHNKNDNAETIIMNLLRGSGVSGLKGIEAKRGVYIRPLIECERSEIEEYCKENELNPRIDKTNFENIYTRNKIRNIIIPYIKKEFNPNIINTLNRLSEIVSEEEQFIENEVEKAYKKILIDEIEKTIILDLKLFNEQEKVIKSRILLYTITKLFGNSKGIEKIHIEDIIELCSNKIGNKYLTPNKNTKVLIKQNKIYISKI